MSVQIYEMANTGGNTASGFFEVNTVKISGAILKHVFVDFGSTDCDFEFKMIDNNDRNIIHINSCNTVLNRTYDIPVKGIYTVIISNATADDNFKLRVASQDAI